MLEQVENKIRELKKQQKDEYYRKKDADLIQWGLTSSKSGNKTTPLVVTDEEYEALIDASNGVGMPARNTVAKVLNVTAVAIVTIGVIAGFLLFSFIEESGVFYCLGAVAISVVVALLFRGVAEAIHLLQQLVDAKDIEATKKESKHDKEFPDIQPTVVHKFSEIAVEENGEKKDFDF